MVLHVSTQAKDASAGSALPAEVYHHFPTEDDATRDLEEFGQTSCRRLQNAAFAHVNSVLKLSVNCFDTQ